MSPIRTQIVFDAVEPHALASFWAAALHYEPEEIDAFVRGLLNAGAVPADLVTEVDGKGGGRRWRRSAIPTTGSTSGAQGPVAASCSRQYRRPRPVKNRVHLDLLVGPEGCNSEVERLDALGATVLNVHEGDDGRWVLMSDPEGNEFDVS